MKKLVLALTALTALAATPAFAGGTHISVGFYQPVVPVYSAPVYAAPVVYYPPTVYYPPVHNVYYAPPRFHGRHYEAWNRGPHQGRGYATAWNDRHDDRDDRGRGGWHH